MVSTDKRLKYLCSSTSAVIYTAKASEDYKTTFFSENVVNLVGYNSKELIGNPQRWIDHVHPADQPSVSHKMKRVIDNNQTVFEYRFQCKDGTYIWVRDESGLVRDSDGRPFEIVGFCVDITDRKRAEIALKKQKNFAESLIETAPVIVLVLDVQGRIVWVNPYFEKISGYRQQAVKGKDWFDTFLPADIREQVRKLFFSGISDTQTWGNVNAILTKDKGERTIEWYDKTLKDETGKVIGLLCIGQDITERQRAEDALTESEQKLNAVFSNAFAFAGLLTIDGTLIKANTSSLKFINAQEADVYGKPFWETPWWSHSLKMQKQLRSAITKAAQGTFLRFEVIFSARDGSSRVYDFSLQPVKNEAGKVVFIIPEGRDITDLRNAEKALRESEEFSSSLLQSSPIPIAVYNPDTSIRYVNPEFEKVTGFSFKELAGKKAPYPWWTDDQVKKTWEELKNAMSQGAYKTEEYFTHKQGSPFWVEINFRPIKKHRTVKYFLSNWVEITDRKQVESALREQIKRNDLILQTTMNGFLITDMEGQITQANAAASKITGYSQQELTRMNIVNLECGVSKQKLQDREKKLISRGYIRFEAKLRRKGEKLRIIEVSQNILLDAGQQLFFYFFNDIDNRKQAEAALIEREQQLADETSKLEEVNTALEVLLKKREEDKAKLEEKLVFNVEKLIFPYLEKLKKSRLNTLQKSYADILETNLKDITAPFSYNLSSRLGNLTQAEIEIANLIMQGKTNKEIADVFCLSVRTIESHRKNIRIKTGILNKKINLRTWLLSLQ